MSQLIAKIEPKKLKPNQTMFDRTYSNLTFFFDQKKVSQ